jgi:glutamine amidotransferase-like uncharacterized protein
MAQNANSLWSGITFSGSGTGTRFLIHTGAQITLDGTNNLTFFPGTASGIVYEGGTYDKIFSTGGVAVSSLPAPNVGIAGARNLVVDANSTTFMSTVAGGGANIVPVVCDGTNWKIG